MKPKLSQCSNPVGKIDDIKRFPAGKEFQKFNFLIFEFEYLV